MHVILRYFAILIVLSLHLLPMDCHALQTRPPECAPTVPNTVIQIHNMLYITDMTGLDWDQDDRQAAAITNNPRSPSITGLKYGYCTTPSFSRAYPVA